MAALYRDAGADVDMNGDDNPFNMSITPQAECNTTEQSTLHNGNMLYYTTIWYITVQCYLS